MNDNDVIVNPIYYENTIHVTDAIFTNEPETFVIAIPDEDIIIDDTIDDTIVNTRFIFFKDCMNCIYVICYMLYVICCMLFCCFLFFILLGGIGVFFMN